MVLSGTTVSGLVLWKICHLQGHKRFVLPEYGTLLQKNVGDTSLNIYV